MKLLRYVFTFLVLSSGGYLWADSFRLDGFIGSTGLSIFKDELVGTFLLPFCRHDAEIEDNFKVIDCSFGNGRPLKTDKQGNLIEKEAFLSIPGSNLRNGFFSRQERASLDSIDFANEIVKTDSGKLLFNLYQEKLKNINIRLFYHVERAKDLYSSFLTREMLASQPHEHFGFTVSKDGRALIGINADQNHEEAFYTYVHELYHLFDPEVKENPTADQVSRQEIRALLFELRIYLERQQKVPNDRYSDSKFHRNFIVNGSIDWAKVGYYVDARFFPTPVKNKFVFSSKPVDVLDYEKGVETLEGGLLFNEVLLKLFEAQVQKSKEEQDETTIVARLRYSISKEFNEQKAAEKADIIRRMYRGFASMFEQDYGHIIHGREVPLRTDRINNITTGVPRPRDGGGP